MHPIIYEYNISISKSFSIQTTKFTKIYKWIINETQLLDTNAQFHPINYVTEIRVHFD